MGVDIDCLTERTASELDLLSCSTDALADPSGSRLERLDFVALVASMFRRDGVSILHPAALNRLQVSSVRNSTADASRGELCRRAPSLMHVITAACSHHTLLTRRTLRPRGNRGVSTRFRADLKALLMSIGPRRHRRDPCSAMYRDDMQPGGCRPECNLR